MNCIGLDLFNDDTCASGHISRPLLLMSQHCFGQWLDAARQQAITWANVHPVLCHHVVSLGHNKWIQLDEIFSSDTQLVAFICVMILMLLCQIQLIQYRNLQHHQAITLSDIFHPVTAKYLCQEINNSINPRIFFLFHFYVKYQCTQASGFLESPQERNTPEHRTHSVSLYSPNNRHLPVIRAVQGDCLGKMMEIPKRKLWKSMNMQ